MEIEKEVRYKIDKSTISKVLSLTESHQTKQEMLDITFGKYGFNSLAKTGYICRIRQKSGAIKLEVKKRTAEHEWLEQSIELNDVKSGANLFKLLDLEPYLYLKRFREVRKFKSLKIFIDELELVGDFIEIEYQDSVNSQAELEEFLNATSIKNEPQGLYGDIVKEKLETDKEFKVNFQNGLMRVINGQNEANIEK